MKKIKLESKIIVSGSLRGAHPLVQRTQKAFESASLDKYGRFIRRMITMNGGLDVYVSKASVNRALRIMDALINAADKRGYVIEVVEEKFDCGGQVNGRTQFTANGEHVQFKMLEPTTRRLNDAPPAKSEMDFRHKYLHDPSGKLQLIIETYLGAGYQRIWEDGKRNRLESLLDSFFGELMRGIDKLKQNKIEDEQRRKVEAENKLRTQELLAQQQLELARGKDLETKAMSWEKSLKIRQFLEAVENTAQNNMDPELQGWIVWGRKYADMINPLNDQNSLKNWS